MQSSPSHPTIFSKSSQLYGAVLVGLVHLLFAGPATAQSWPQFGGPTANFQLSLPELNRDQWSIEKVWQQSIGSGKSSLVSSQEQLFVAFRRELKLPPQAGGYEEGLVALDLKTGNPQWEYIDACVELKDQESFSGDPRAPQATPVLNETRVFSLGFTGILVAVDQKTGKRIWKQDLVAELQAPPVQFGFSGSPILWRDNLLVLAGGPSAGLICCRQSDGAIVWKAPLDNASYATPVLTTLAGVSQVLVVTTERLVAIDPSNGERLWAFDLPESGLTNVPQPLNWSDDRVLLAGQGINGTTMLKLTRSVKQWQVEPIWQTSKSKFFYNNWLSWDKEFVLGCTENGVTLINPSDGNELGRFRLAANGNAVRLNERQLLICSGKGTVSLVERLESGFQEVARWPALNERVWAAPTIIDANSFALRGGDQVALFRFQANGSIANQLEEPKLFPFATVK